MLLVAYGRVTSQQPQQITAQQVADQVDATLDVQETLVYSYDMRDHPLVRQGLLNIVLPPDMGGQLLDPPQPVQITPTGARRVTWWRRPGPNQYHNGGSPAQQNRAFQQFVADYEAVCNVDLVEVANSNQAQLRFYFANRDQMRIPGSNPPAYALGLYWGGGRIWLNRTRDIGLRDNPESTIPTELLKHETGHHFNLPHVADRTCTMGTYATNVWWCPNDALKLQGKLGTPTQTFYPQPKADYGQQIRTLTAKWNQLRNQRAELIDHASSLPPAEATPVWQEMLQVNKQVKDTHAEIRRYIDLWKKERIRWQSVPKAG